MSEYDAEHGTDEAAPQRGATRAPIRKPVRLQFDDALEVVEGVCQNVSIGGMFVRSSDARPIGALVRFELVLEDEASIRGLAEVVWMRATDKGPQREAGMGLKFRFLEQRDRQMIFKLVSQHIKERLATRHGVHDLEPPEEQAPKMPPIRTSPMVEVASEKPEPAQSPAPTSPTPPREPIPRPAPVEAPRDPSGQTRLFGPAADESRDEPIDEGDDIERSAAWMSDGLGGPDALAEQHSAFDAAFDRGMDDGSEPVYQRLEEIDAPVPDEYQEGYESELYADDTHFEHRPRQRRDVPILTVAAVVVAVLAGAVYMWGDRLFGGDPADVAPTGPETTQGATDDQVASDPEDQAGDDRGGDEKDGSSDPPPASTVTSPDPPPTAPPPTTPPLTAPPPSAPPPTTAPSGRPFTEIESITSRQVGEVLRVIVATNGDVDESRFRHSRIAGGAPRELVRLLGVAERFERPVLEVGSPQVQRIRTGWHQKSAGNELHIVLDLGSATARVTGIRADGRRLVISVEG